MTKSIGALVACLGLLNAHAVKANQPPPAKTLVERVELATHVIVGVAKRVRVMQLRDGKLQEIKPEPKMISPSEQIIEVDIDIKEVLYPSAWKPPKSVRYFFGGGFFSVSDVRTGAVGRSFIYLLISNPFPELKNETDIFFPSYGWHLADSLDDRKEIQAVLDARVQREGGNKVNRK